MEQVCRRVCRSTRRTICERGSHYPTTRAHSTCFGDATCKVFGARSHIIGVINECHHSTKGRPSAPTAATAWPSCSSSSSNLRTLQLPTRTHTLPVRHRHRLTALHLLFHLLQLPRTPGLAHGPCLALLLDGLPTHLNRRRQATCRRPHARPQTHRTQASLVKHATTRTTGGHESSLQTDRSSRRCLGVSCSSARRCHTAEQTTARQPLPRRQPWSGMLLAEHGRSPAQPSNVLAVPT